MTRLEALEAVAEAAEILAHSAGVIRGRTPEDADIYTHELEHIRHLMAMLSTLDASPPRRRARWWRWRCGNGPTGLSRWQPSGATKTSGGANMIVGASAPSVWLW